jgi:hypothetical protein
VTTDDSGLRSVNWISGMLLTPEHFGAQDRYIDSAFGWLLRNAIPATGLLAAASASTPPSAASRPMIPGWK